jgi:hypothetical protein
VLRHGTAPLIYRSETAKESCRYRRAKQRIVMQRIKKR